jgi:hypothetical protein
VHQLAREAGGRPERAQREPRAGAVAGLLLELASSGELRVLGSGGVLGRVEAPGRDFEQDALRRRPPLADEQDAILGVDRDDRDRAGVTDDVALRTGAVGPLDRIDPEGEVATTVEDATVDDPLDELIVGGPRIERGLGLARTGKPGPGGRIGQAATASRSEVRLAPDSASKRWSFV